MLDKFKAFWSKHPIIGTLLAVLGGVFAVGLITASLKLILVIALVAGVVMVGRSLFGGSKQIPAEAQPRLPQR